MRYWWVNQNQTYRQEWLGGYLWSPKRRANQTRNPYYEFMREVAPGDLVLSFQGTYIRKVGVAQSYCYEAPKPSEFGTVGAYWDNIGWRVDVRYFDLIHQIRPADHIEHLNNVLPSRYSPLLNDGRGSQSIYLTEVPAELMHVLAQLIGHEARTLMKADHLVDGIDGYGKGLAEWEEHLIHVVEHDTSIADTVRSQLILARRGQGRFKKAVRHHESLCRVTKVSRLEHLRASHIKPWRDSTNDERLDGENGFLLTPSIDHLFDRGFVSFEDNGRLIISPRAHSESLVKMGVPVDKAVQVGRFTEGQKAYLDHHRNEVFLESKLQR